MFNLGKTAFLSDTVYECVKEYFWDWKTFPL